jgi:hypothetical protein
MIFFPPPKSPPKKMNHKWEKNQAYGSGPGRPHGVDESWTCARCAMSRGRGPQSTHTGRRIIRWYYLDDHGYPTDRLPECPGGRWVDDRWVGKI